MCDFSYFKIGLFTIFYKIIAFYPVFLYFIEYFYYLGSLTYKDSIIAAPMSKKKIVLAEDNATLSMLLKFRLEKEGYELFSTVDGKDALESIETIKPDLIITDIMMPYISGLEVISHVRHKLNSEVPIIVFSSAGQEEMVLKAFDLGANDFMGKPFSPNELVIRVKKLVT